jgi:hypothetical protein
MAILRYEHDTVMFAVFGMAAMIHLSDVRRCVPSPNNLRPPTFWRPFGRPNLLERQRSIGSRRAVGAGTTKARLLPGGLLVVGDAVCSFNPIYGQGMTVAALEALAPAKCLPGHRISRGGSSSYAKPIGKACSWQPAVTSPCPRSRHNRRSDEVAHRYMDRLLTAPNMTPPHSSNSTRWPGWSNAPVRLLRPSMIARLPQPNNAARYTSHTSHRGQSLNS